MDVFNQRPTNEEQLRRLQAEAERLANLPELERACWLSQPHRTKALGVAPAALQALVKSVINERNKRAAAEQREQERKRRQREREQQQQEREQRRAKAEAERAKKRAEQAVEKEKRRAEKEAERKNKERMKGFASILQLPVARHDVELAKLAKRLDVDEAALCRRFKEFVGIREEGDRKGYDWSVVLWHEPVDSAELLYGIEAKIVKHILLQQLEQSTVVTLWTAHSWVHNAIAIHSPILEVTAPEINTGKTTLLSTVSRLVPKPSMDVEITGPALFHLVDAHQPCLILDETDDLFHRKSDLKHIVNQSWTRGATVPRCVSIGGVRETVHFNVFCPKAIGLLGRKLPPALQSRTIKIVMARKRHDETVEPFQYADDAEFAQLRRKLARWAADNMAAIKNAKPTIPSDLDNRVAANWHLLLAIAELAGGSWPERAREAAERLTRAGRRPSDGVRLLAEFREIFDSGRKMITSHEMVTNLRRDPTSVWADYNKGGPVTERQIAKLLGEDRFEIYPIVIHPTGRSNLSRHGYRVEQFADAFARYLPGADSNIQTLPLSKPKKAAAKKKSAVSRVKREKRKKNSNTRWGR
jgi:putative DNA primase/helicase